MSPEEVRYRILVRLQQQPTISQRQLSQELGVSLGKVNYCLQALIKKGFVKTQNFRRSPHKAAYWYLLTPTGLEEKLQQTRAFLHIKRTEYDLLKTEIAHLKDELARTEKAS